MLIVQMVDCFVKFENDMNGVLILNYSLILMFSMLFPEIRIIPKNNINKNAIL